MFLRISSSCGSDGGVTATATFFSRFSYEPDETELASRVHACVSVNIFCIFKEAGQRFDYFFFNYPDNPNHKKNRNFRMLTIDYEYVIK